MARKKAPASTKKANETKEKKTTSKKQASRVTKQGFDIKAYLSRIGSNIKEKRSLYARYLLIVLIVVLVGLFAYLKKDWFVVAIVNNQPITTLELYQNLKSQSGQEVLDQLIRDKLIIQEANKKGISVNQGEIDKKIKEIEEQVGGKDQLENALTTRNITQEAFREQIRVQLLVEKILEKEIAVTDKEVEDYIAKNPAETQTLQKEEVRSQLRANKLNEKFQEWYSQVQKNSRISKFI